jgi:hypothetical protein
VYLPSDIIAGVKKESVMTSECKVVDEAAILGSQGVPCVTQPRAVL